MARGHGPLKVPIHTIMPSRLLQGAKQNLDVEISEYMAPPRSVAALFLDGGFWVFPFAAVVLTVSSFPPFFRKKSGLNRLRYVDLLLRFDFEVIAANLQPQTVDRRQYGNQSAT